MSDIIEKTIASLPGLIAGATGLGGDKQVAVSRAFQSFVNSLGAIHSKYDEEQFIKKELALQKQRLAQPNLSPGQIKESLVRLVYCHILGYDVSFAYIHAVKLAQQGTLFGKRAGYLVSSLFLRDDNELVMLLVNTIQKDLKSTNMLTVCMALTAASQLITTEMIPALLPLVEERLKHQKEIVRKKAVLCMHSFHCKAPELLRHAHHHFKSALCDKDPGVMWASLHVFYDLVQKDPAAHKDLIRNLIEVEFQVLNRKLPMEYEFHNVPAPWLQIQILKLLNKLGTGDPEASQMMYAVLKDVLQRTNPSHKIGLAVIYECLETILSIWPQPAMVEHAANCVAKFLSSKNINLRYLGLKALSHVVKINSGYALEHQDVVIDCLEHPDPTIQRKTLELLYSMANPDNLQVICNHMLAHLHKDSADEYLKTDIISKVIHLTQKYGRDKKWHIDTVFKVLSLAGDDSPKGVLNNTAKILIDGCEDGISTNELRMYAVQLSWKILKQKSWPNVIIQLVTWILGEYGHMQKETLSYEIVKELESACTLPKVSSTATAWILSAMLKIGLRDPKVLTDVDISQLRERIETDNMESAQRLNELESLQMQKNKESFKPSNCDEILKNADFTLSFLDEYVADELEKGSQPYKNESMRNPQPVIAREKQSIFAGLNFNPYEEPGIGSGPPSLDITGTSGSNTGSVASNETREKHGGLQLKVAKKVWGKEGIIKRDIKELKVEESDNTPQECNDVLEDDLSSESMRETSDGTERRKELASALFSGLKSPTHSALLTSSDVILGGESPALSSGVSSAKSASSNPSSIKTLSNTSAVRPGQLVGETEANSRDEGLMSPSNPTTELLTAESLMSPSEGHWVSLHRDLTSPEERQLTDYIGIIDSESNDSLCTEEVLNSGILHTDVSHMKMCAKEKDSSQPFSMDSHAVSLSEHPEVEGSDSELHEPDSLEDLGPSLDEDQQANAPLETDANVSIVPKDFDRFPSEKTKTHILDSEQLKVWYQKVWEPEKLKIILKVEPSSVEANKEALLVRHCPTGGDELCPVEISEMSTEGIAIITVPSFTNSIHLEVTSGSSISKMKFLIPMLEMDFLRPHVIEINEFTRWWKENAQEKVTSRTADQPCVEEYVAALCQMLHLHTVKLTGNEALVAGKLLNSNTCVTGHILHSDSTINIRMRSSLDSLLEQLMSFVSDNQF